MTEPWLYAGVAFLAVAHLLVLVVAYRVRSPGSGGVDREGPGPAEGATDPEGGDETHRGRDDGETVRCRDCGTENGPEYRFCRWCVAELPGRSIGASAPRSPTSRRIL